MKPVYLLFAFLILFAEISYAQTPKDATVALHTQVSLSPASIRLEWPMPNPGDILIKRRKKGDAGNQWITLINETGSNTNTITDNGVFQGETYEYHIRTIVNGITAHGYAQPAVLSLLTDYRGKILVFIDSTTADEVGLELKIFKDAMRGDGWQPMPFKTGPSATPQSIKAQIVAAYNTDPENIKAVLIIGPVPVPYSGNSAWDGHTDHFGAWPSDAFYADVNGIWTDVSVNNTTPSRAANVNIPGDGKYDQSYIPSPAELMVGRIDFRHLDPVIFGATPNELIKRYLLKNARWRKGLYKVPNRALVDDNFGYFSGEAFAANGYRNAYPLVGESNVMPGDFLADTGGEGYLLGYGTGGGSYTSASGVATSAQIAADSINIVFANIFGSYHGDWDYENNPLMPAALASKGGILTCSWAGRPHWMMQALASGETMGYCTKETLNSQYNSEYFNSSGRSGAHVALLGDPTVRATIIAQVPDLQLLSACSSINLSWQPSPDTGILGYHVYRSETLDGPYLRQTIDLVNGLNWTDNTPPADTLFYQVRAVRIDETPGGGKFYNASSGIIQWTVFTPGNIPQITIAPPEILTCSNDIVTLSATSSLPLTGSISWSGPGGFNSIGNQIDITEPGIYTASGITADGCLGTATIAVVQDINFPTIVAPPAILNCVVPSVTLTLPELPGIEYYYLGQPVPPWPVISAPGVYTIQAVNTATGCTQDINIAVEQDVTIPNCPIVSSTFDLTCANPEIILSAGCASSNIGYQWISGGPVDPGINITVSTPGVYCLIATDLTNGCTTEACVEITSSIPTQPGVIPTPPSSPGASDGAIDLVLISGTPATFLWSTGATTEDIQGLSEGTYTVLISYPGTACETTLTIDLSAGVATGDIAAFINASLSPNPATESTTLDIQLSKPEALEMRLVDINGTLIQRLNGEKSTRHTFLIPTAALPAGNYWIYLRSDTQVQTQSLIVIH